MVGVPPGWTPALAASPEPLHTSRTPRRGPLFCAAYPSANSAAPPSARGSWRSGSPPGILVSTSIRASRRPPATAERPAAPSMTAARRDVGAAPTLLIRRSRPADPAYRSIRAGGRRATRLGAIDVLHLRQVRRSGECPSRRTSRVIRHWIARRPRRLLAQSRAPRWRRR